MTRVILCAGLALAIVAVAVFTGMVQSKNRERGRVLDDLRSECLLIEAVNGERSAQIVGIDQAPLDPDLFGTPKKDVAR